MTSDDMTYQRRNWRVQRIGWAGMALVLLLGLAGLLGDGPIAHAMARAGGLEVRYDRIVRLEAPAAWDLVIPPDADGRVRLTLDQALLARIRVEALSPAPERTTLIPGGQLLEFPAGAGPALVRMQFVPERMGRLRTAVTGASQAVRLSLIVLP